VGMRLDRLAEIVEGDTAVEGRERLVDRGARTERGGARAAAEGPRRSRALPSGRMAVTPRRARPRSSARQLRRAGPGDQLLHEARVDLTVRRRAGARGQLGVAREASLFRSGRRVVFARGAPV
jgi:hypothetical protein